MAKIKVLLLSLILMAPAGWTEESGRSVLVFGGTGRTGVEIVKRLHEQGDAVTVFVRPTSDRSPVEFPGVEFVVGDALNADDVSEAFATENFDATISAIGRRRGEARPDYQANANLFRAAVAAGVSRFVLISSMGVGNSREFLPEVPEFMVPVLDAKTRAEDELMESGLAYTIIRPGRLLSGPATGNAVWTEDVSVIGFAINRADLGALTVSALDEPGTIGKILHAYDPGADPQQGR